MKKILIASVVMIALALPALAAEIADIAWNQSNLVILSGFDKDAVVRFVNQVSGNEGTIYAATRNSIGDFRWYDLAGDGRYELVAVYDVNGRGFFNDLAIYTRDGQGKIARNDIEGFWIGKDLGKVIRDLDGNGQKELVIPTLLGGYKGAASVEPNVIWFKVYRLKDGEYVEASSDFPRYYDDEVLPGLDQNIAKLQQQADAIPPAERRAAQVYMSEHGGWWAPYDNFAQWWDVIMPARLLASAVMARDKILRVLGRDPEAGLQQAREWTSSEDPVLVGDAIEVLTDMGGHEQELRAAKEAGKRIVERDRKAKERAAAGS